MRDTSIETHDAILAMEVAAQVGAARALRLGSEISRRLDHLTAHALVTAHVHAVGPLATFLTQPLVL